MTDAPATSSTRTAARLIVDQLAAFGVDLVFGVPGESYLAVLDALIDRDDVRFVTCRQESGAGFAAAASSLLTGRPGVAMVTRGPGVANIAGAIHSARQDETPLVVLVGLVPRRHRGRDAFQEIDLDRTFGHQANWTHVLDDVEQIPEVLARAWHAAISGRPGPVVIGLPEDLLDEPVTAAPVPVPRVAASAVDAATASRVADLLRGAQRPVVVAGGTRWTERSIEQLPKVLRGIPLTTAFRRQDLVDQRGPTCAGWLGLGSDPALARRVHDADVLVALGDRLDDPTTDSYGLVSVPTPSQLLVHVHPDPREIGRVFTPTIGIAAEPGALLDALDALGGVDPSPAAVAWAAAARDDATAYAATDTPLDAIARRLRELTRPDVVVTHGAGNFTRPIQRSFGFARPARQLGPTSGTMGYGLPAAIAAQLVHPDRQVVCVAGDGELLMTGQEMATAAQADLPIVVLVVDNSSYGTIRTHQERRYPGRRFATDLRNPDFAVWARSFGAEAWTARTVDEVLDALAAALACNRLALVHWLQG